MKIVQVCPRYYPYPGGLERVVKNISDRLALMNNEVTVYATDPLIPTPRSRKIKNVEVKYYPSLAPNEAYFLPHPGMFADLLNEETDVLHANNIQVLTTLVANIVHKIRSGSRLVLSPFYHGRGHTKLAQMLWIPYRPIAKNIVRSVDAIIVNSESQKSLIKRSFNSSAAMYKVYDGVNVQEIRSAISYDIDKKRKILLYVGRLEKYKNIHLTIRALKYLPGNYDFYVIGRGPFRPELENLVNSLNLKSRVHFLGFQPDDVVYRWMKSADVFLHLSAVESFGMTCIESLAAGTPVIANEDGLGLSETIDLYPRDILPYRAEKDHCQVLVSLVQEAVSLKPTKADVSSFSWDSIAVTMDNIYERIVKE